MSHAELQPWINFSFQWIRRLILLAYKVSENSERSFSELKVPCSNRLFLFNQKSEKNPGVQLWSWDWREQISPRDHPPPTPQKEKKKTEFKNEFPGLVKYLNIPLHTGGFFYIFTS